jgi:hypothetical protein
VASALRLLDGRWQVSKFSVVFQGAMLDPSGQRVPPDEAEMHLDRVLDELEVLKAEDPAIGAALAQGEVEITVSVEADSLDEAQAKGSAVIRSAVHAAGVATPDWSIDWCRGTVQRFDLVDA